jgi:restriction system protein
VGAGENFVPEAAAVQRSRGESVGMAVPKFDALMLPLLKIAEDGQEHRLADVVPAIADGLNLSGADRAEQIPSGQSRLRNRVYWAKLYLSQAKALDTVRPGIFRITDRGHELLSSQPSHITPDDLMAFPEFRAFRAKSKSKTPSGELLTESIQNSGDAGETPEDAIQTAYDQLKAAVVSDLLDAVRSADPLLLSAIMVKLLIKMGYGDEESGIVLDGVNDGGVDGVVKKDRLGLSSVYIQAKRYKDGNGIGAPAIQQFAGSMQERRADEGVFVATSTFTKAALESVTKLRSRIVLIDGQRLAELMFELGVGVKTQSHLTLKRIDPDFFAES